MSSDLYSRVQEKIEWHELEIKKLKDWLVTYKELTNEIGLGGGDLIMQERSQSASREESLPRSPARSRRATNKDALLNAAAEILELEQPLPTQALFERLTERGIEISGKDPAHNLTNYLGREKGRFKSKRGEGWSLVQPSSADDEKQKDSAKPADAGMEDHIANLI